MYVWRLLHARYVDWFWAFCSDVWRPPSTAFYSLAFTSYCIPMHTLDFTAIRFHSLAFTCRQLNSHSFKYILFHCMYCWTCINGIHYIHCIHFHLITFTFIHSNSLAFTCFPLYSPTFTSIYLHLYSHNFPLLFFLSSI